MVKGNHWQGHGKTNQRKGRWELRSSTDCLQVKGTLPTRHSIRVWESKAIGLGEGDGGEFGRVQSNILT